MEKLLNERESLELINSMIVQAKNNLQKGAGVPTLIAGYTVALVSILNYILIYTLAQPNNAFSVWWLMIPMTLVLFIIASRSKKKAMHKNHIDSIIQQIWRTYCMSIAILLITVVVISSITHSSIPLTLITPIILILSAFAQNTTGVACKYSPLRWGALMLAIGALACLAIYNINPNLQFIILAVSFVTGFIIPGHMLNRKAKQNV